MSKGSLEVYTALREDILAGMYPPNTHLTAQEVGEKLSVSRTPAREGLLRLAAEGLVNVLPNQGAFVASWSPSELVDIYAVRAVLEPLAAAAAATRINDADFDQLEMLVEKMETALAKTPRDATALLECNDRFHRIVAEASGNKKLIQSIFSVMAMPMASTAIKLSSEARLARIMNHYRELIVAFRARDPEWARAAMLCHVLSAKSLYMRLAAGEPDPGM